MLIPARSPAFALFANSASASSARASETMSASPRARISSPTSGALIRLEAITGICTASFRRRVAQAKPPRGTACEMVGMRASCQPMPVLSSDAPADSIPLASCTISSPERPPSTSSSAEMR